MRLLFTFCFFLLSLKIMGQIAVDSNSVLSNFKKNQSDVKIKIRCMASKSSTVKPLLIIDGVLAEFEKLNCLNPDDIESVAVLKDSLLSGIFSCRSNNKGVIIITTKTYKFRKFQIRDLFGGNNIPGATVTFIPNKSYNQTLRFAANDSGIVTTDKLKAGIDYNVTITSAGYKPLSIVYKKDTKPVEAFLLERDVQEFAPLTIQSGRGFGCRRTINCRVGRAIVCSLNQNKILKDSGSLDMHSIYPNPVKKGAAVTIEVRSVQTAYLYVKFFTADGRELLSQSVAINNGINKIPIQTDSRWTAGVYFVQVIDEKNHPVELDKIIVE